MLNILVADNHTKENNILCQKLSTNIEIKTKSTTTGVQTLNVYHSLSPQILILNSRLDDMSFNETIDRLSSTVSERNKCNILLTLDKEEDMNSLTNLSKIWKIFKNPLDYDELIETIDNMKSYFEIPTLKEDDLDSMLLDLNFHLGADGTKYMKTAIVECYYDKSMFHALDNIYSIVAKIKNKTEKEIRDGMRSSIIPLNKYGSFNTDDNVLKLLKLSKSVGVKFFLEVFVTHLHEIKNKEINKNK